MEAFGEAAFLGTPPSTIDAKSFFQELRLIGGEPRCFGDHFSWSLNYTDPVRAEELFSLQPDRAVLKQYAKEQWDQSPKSVDHVELGL